MIRLVRITGFLLIVVGAVIILTWLIEPLREILSRDELHGQESSRACLP